MLLKKNLSLHIYNVLFFLQFISQWKPALLLVPPVHHGEKFSHTLPQEMDTKHQDLVDLEACYLQCVDPHEVNPIIAGGNKHTTEYQINFNVTNVDMSESGGFYDPPQVKLEMEEFKDLSSFLPDLQPSTSSNTIDELNTPIFDKDEFDFSVQAKPSSYSFKHEPDPYGNPFIYNGLTDRSEVLQNESTFSHISNNILQNNETSYVIQPTEINSGSSDSGQSPQYQTTMNDSLQSYVNGSSVICTPEESNSSNTSSNGSPNLYLNTNIINSLSQINSLSTPDVIDTVVEMDGNFNILDFVPSEEITTVNPEDIFSTYSLPEKHQVQAQPEKPSRRKRKISDSDEEYVPPVKSRKSYAGLHSSESDSDYEEPKPKKRGKGRKASSTSNDSREENVSRYRDLRDKNNEASRRSRLKRKQKELEIEKECDELTEKNIKLKAQVEELEKTVSSYRDNLFKIMLKK
ncbi:hepatoma-derived growth factor-related protein 2 isoform X2 [Aethina tumida]|uniref:hepatoma-derived growth factor-related protein 2 isoform X2 n=1 Tax=Aethina tumida TaxID=116153 RepID=UPI00096B52C5|nr:hepatoma-derived growth factor-related protein 2 isoform X2 [Aethina tumida]